MNERLVASILATSTKMNGRDAKGTSHAVVRRAHHEHADFRSCCCDLRRRGGMPRGRVLSLLNLLRSAINEDQATIIYDKRCSGNDCRVDQSLLVAALH